MSGRSPPLYCTLILITMHSHQSYPNLTTVRHSYEYSPTIDIRYILIYYIILNYVILSRSTPVAQLAPRNLLTRWDVSSIPANGIFLTKNQKNKIKMPNGWRTINSLVHKIRLHGRRGKGMAESFSRQKSRHAPQKEGGLKILCDLPPV